MGDELSRLASFEAECHRKDGVIAALRDEVGDFKAAALQASSNSLRYIHISGVPTPRDLTYNLETFVTRIKVPLSTPSPLKIDCILPTHPVPLQKNASSHPP